MPHIEASGEARGPRARAIDVLASRPSNRRSYEATLERTELIESFVRARKARAMTQQDLAETIGTTQSAVSDLESGRVQPQLRTCQRYARAVGYRLRFRVTPNDASPVNLLLQQSDVLTSSQCLVVRNLDAAGERPGWAKRGHGSSQGAIDMPAVAPQMQESYEDTLERTGLVEAFVCARKTKGVTQREVGKKMNTTQSAISDFESGRVQPQLRTCQRYAQALDYHFQIVLDPLESPLDGVSEVVAESDAYFLQVAKERALSSLLTTLVRESEKRSRTVLALAESSGLPVPWITKTLASLEDNGWASPSREGGSISYRISETACTIGISIHRDRVVGVLVDIYGDAFGSQKELRIPNTDYETVLSASRDLIAALFFSTGKRILGVGLSLAGVVDCKSGRVNYAPALQSPADTWRGRPFERDLQLRVLAEISEDLRIAVENDVNALAAWEWLHTADDSVVTFLLSGLGIGAGLIFHGKLLQGAHSSAGEIGHLIVSPGGEECPKSWPGNRHAGCLEAVANVDQILSRLGYVVGTSSQRQGALADVDARLSSEVSWSDVGSAEWTHPVGRAFFEAGQACGKAAAQAVITMDPAKVSIYADGYLTEAQHFATARAFKAGFTAAWLGSKESRLPEVDPRWAWHPLHSHTRATAAGATALWHFLQNPNWWAPTLNATSRPSELASI